jgi:hypothetical protein
MSVRRSRVTFVLFAVVFGAVVFLLSSSYLIERGQPGWLAAVVGGLAFPVLPLLWHVVGERRRRARVMRSSAASLDPGDRYVLRAVVIAALVLAPMFAIGRLAVVRAAWDHRTWFVPAFTGDGHAARGPLLARVPADAEAVVLVIGDGISALGKRIPPGLLAYGDHQLLAIGPHGAGEPPAEIEIAQINQLRSKLPMFAIDPLVKVSESDGVVVAASARWAARGIQPGSGPGRDLGRELDRAPADATVVAGFAPPAPVDGIRRAAGWVTFVENGGEKVKVVLDARIETVHTDETERLLEEARGIWNAGRSELPASCRDRADAVASGLAIERSATALVLHLELEPDKLAGLAMCAMGLAPQ